MMYSFQLKGVGLVVGLGLILWHVLALTPAARLRERLPQFPRSRMAGLVLLALVAAWSLYLVLTMDLGEFSGMRRVMALGVVVLAALSAIYVPEFLAVRALGMLALLASEPVLEAAFLRPELTRLLIVALAYVWIFLGLFWVGLPWLLRDQIGWATASEGRFRLLAALGLAYGVAVTACAIFFW